MGSDRWALPWPPPLQLGKVRVREDDESKRQHGQPRKEEIAEDHASRCEALPALACQPDLPTSHVAEDDGREESRGYQEPADPQARAPMASGLVRPLVDAEPWSCALMLVHGHTVDPPL